MMFLMSKQFLKIKNYVNIYQHQTNPLFHNFNKDIVFVILWKRTLSKMLYSILNVTQAKNRGF